MSSILPRLSATLLIFVFSSAALADECFVIGDIRKNNPSEPQGSEENPYGSLAAVEADTGCDTIIILHSRGVLDGGINLRDGQELKGQIGRSGRLPIISNTTAITNNGHGVQLAANNTITDLHIKDTYNSGVSGGNVGNLSIENSVITRFGQSEALDFLPPGVIVSPPGITLLPADDVKIRISESQLGESNSISIAIIPSAGHADIVIEEVAVRDQGHVAGADNTPGIVVIGIGASSVDLKVVNTSVSNIGSGDCNCDGMLFLAFASSAMEVLVDGYSYVNPDGDGGGSATGLEIGNFFGLGASFEATVKNSTFQGGTSTAIQIIDQASGNNNFLTVHIHDNEIYDAAFSGIELDVGFGASFGTDILTIENNLIVNAGGSGIVIASIFEPQNVLNGLLQRNTIINSGFAGLQFVQVLGASAATLNLDAGLGGLGSDGKNRIIGSQQSDIFVDAFGAAGFNVSAADNWWGSDAGPATVIELNGATVDVIPFLTEDPEDKKKGKN